MGVIVWLLIPLVAVIVAMLWTAALARKERRRADERWRAQRLAELGGVLTTTTTTPAHNAGADFEESLTEVPDPPAVDLEAAAEPAHRGGQADE